MKKTAALFHECFRVESVPGAAPRLNRKRAVMGWIGDVLFGEAHVDGHLIGRIQFVVRTEFTVNQFVV